MPAKPQLSSSRTNPRSAGLPRQPSVRRLDQPRQTDNAQVIFETLNARGTGLGALDLVKNAIFLQAQREVHRRRSTRREWEPTFEADDYWLAEVRQGRESAHGRLVPHALVCDGTGRGCAPTSCSTARKDILRGVNVRRGGADSAAVPGAASCGFRRFPAAPEALSSPEWRRSTRRHVPDCALPSFPSDLTSARRLRALSALESWLVDEPILPAHGEEPTTARSPASQGDQGRRRARRRRDRARVAVISGHNFGVPAERRSLGLERATSTDTSARRASACCFRGVASWISGPPAKTEAIGCPAATRSSTSCPQSIGRRTALPDDPTGLGREAARPRDGRRSTASESQLVTPTKLNSVAL